MSISRFERLGGVVESTDDLLAFVNKVDREWHDMPRDFEREAMTRLWTLLALPARLLRPGRLPELGRQCISARNVRLTGDAIREIFFKDQQYTEVDGIFFRVGSVLGQLEGGPSYVIEVERKLSDQHGDYYRALLRVRKVSKILQKAFGGDFYPVLIYDDQDAKLSYPTHEDETAVISMGKLRALTEGILVLHPDEIPGRASDKALVKLDLLWLMAHQDPESPHHVPATPKQLAVLAQQRRLSLRLPVSGHQTIDGMGSELQRWLNRVEEDDTHLLEKRLPLYLGELEVAGAIQREGNGYQLSRSGSDYVLGYSRFLDEGRTA